MCSIRRLALPPVMLAVMLLGSMLASPTIARAHDPSAYGGLFRSRDSGATWFPANPGRIVSGAIALAVSPVEPNHLLLATDSGLLRSRNAGLDWSLEAPTLLAGAVFAVAFDDDGHRAIAATGSALFRSEDGQTWSLASFPDDAMPARLLVTAGGGHVYLAGWHRLHRSDDWGASWITLAAPLPGEPVTALLVVRALPRLYAIAGGRLWATEDAREAWRAVDMGLPSGRIDAVVADPGEPRRLWVAAGGQIFLSDDTGVTWMPRGRPISEPLDAVRGLAVSPTARQIVVTTDRGLYRSADGGERWDVPGDTLPAHLEAWPLVREPADPRTLYSGFALIPYTELWRMAAERTTPLARIGPAGLAGGAAFLGLLGLGAAAALRWLRRYDRDRRTLATDQPVSAPRSKDAVS